ncbi:type II secretion system F family protein [uncultured Algibacter sp.]|uniref:type II secretion system F family protein n=1 Tax=uncultured Algibacter sp. TaxID=298659 RepID=UPI0026264931|nr:type II secretion system F family protein [uncultured Algibacter sp.]
MGFQLNKISQSVSKIKKEEPYEGLSFLKKEITLFNNVFSNKIKEDFYIELSVLLKAGVSLKSALELIEKSQKKKPNKDILNTISRDIVSGQTLSDALKSHKQFTNYEFHSIKIGEETGTIAQVVEQLGSFFTRKNEQRSNLISALTYPVIILSTAVLVVVFMLNYVVPMFQDIFKQQGVDLPTITKLIIKVSEFMKAYGGIFLLVFLGLILSKSFLNKSEKFKKLKDIFIIRIPFVGNFVKTVYLSQFTQAVSLLTASKVPVVSSIQLVKQMINFYPLQYALETVEQHVLKGESLSDSLSEHKLFDDKMIALVKVAEETNQTEYIFERLNMQYNIQVQQQSKTLSTLMEPFIILIVGVLVGVILIAMYLPMFKLSSVMG